MLNIPLSKDLPGFVTWNWPLIRKMTFFIFLSFIVAMSSAVFAMIYNMPKTCVPHTEWYQGSVFYEIFPSNVKDSNHSGYGDLKEIQNQIPYFMNLSIRAVRLNSIFPSNGNSNPENYKDIRSLMEVSNKLGTVEDLKNLAEKLNDKNISLILDLPLHVTYERLKPVKNDNSTNEQQQNSIAEEYKRVERNIIDDDSITTVINFWLSKGVKGFYLKGLENFADDQFLGENMIEWHYHLNKQGAIMIVNEALIKRIRDDELADELLKVIHLVDVNLDVSDGTQLIEKQVEDTFTGRLMPTKNGPWIHWTLNGVDKPGRLSTQLSPNVSLATVLMQLMLPGTPSISYGDEISVGKADKEVEDTKHLGHLPTMSFHDKTEKISLPWLPSSTIVNFHHLEYVIDAVKLRKTTPALFKNSVLKDGEEQVHGNTHLRANKEGLLIIERTYPRRNTFVSITNYGSDIHSVDISQYYYSGEIAVGPAKRSKIFFNNFKIKALETVLVKLDK
jgi:hypothetical protein